MEVGFIQETTKDQIYITFNQSDFNKVVVKDQMEELQTYPRYKVQIGGQILDTPDEVE